MLRTDRGRTYDRSRPNRSKRQKSACHGGPSTYDDLRTDLDQLLLQAGQRPVFDRLGRRQCAQEVAEIVGEPLPWAERGSRPPAPRDQRREWAYIFGAVCPRRDIGAALVLP